MLLRNTGHDTTLPILAFCLIRSEKANSYSGYSGSSPWNINAWRGGFRIWDMAAK